MKERSILGLFVLLVLSVFSCEKSSRIETARKVIVLQDSLFAIEVDLPVQLDTFYTWVHYSDNGCAHYRKYRFSNSSYPIVKESGFFYREYQDSCYQLTFSHVDDFECQHPNAFDELKYRVAALEFGSKKDEVKFELYTTEDTVINSHRVQMIAYKTEFQWEEHKHPITLISGLSEIEGRQIRIDCACSGNRCERFVEMMKASINSIKLSNVNYDFVKDEIELGELMTEVSGSCYQAGWLENLEYILWNKVNSPNGSKEQSCISNDNIKRLIELANRSGTWIIWDEKEGRTAIPLTTWRKKFEADIKRDPTLLDIR